MRVGTGSGGLISFYLSEKAERGDRPEDGELAAIERAW